MNLENRNLHPYSWTVISISYITLTLTIEFYNSEFILKTLIKYNVSIKHDKAVFPMMITLRV